MDFWWRLISFEIDSRKPARAERFDSCRCSVGICFWGGGGAENADEGLLDLGLVGPLDGRLVCYGPSHGCACRSGYTDWGEQAGPLGAFVALEVFLVGHCTSVMDVRDERRVWITCRWPNPSFQLATRGSAVTARAFQALSVAGSPHRRPRSPSRQDGEKCA